MRDTTTTKKFKNDYQEKEYNLMFTMLPPSKSLSFMVYIGKVVGGSAGKIIGSLGKVDSIKDLKGSNGDIDISKVGDTLASALSAIDDEVIIEKLDLLFSSVEVEGGELNVDHFMFEGEPMLIFDVAKTAIEVNYKSFLRKNSKVFGKVKDLVKIVKNTKE